MPPNSHQTTYIVIGLAALATGVALWYLTKKSSDGKEVSKSSRSLPNKSVDGATGSSSVKSSTTAAFSSSASSGITPTKSNVTATVTPSPASSSASSTAGKEDSSSDKVLHRRIEEIDRKGKALFKDKKYLEAAETFTEALDLIEKARPSSSSSGSPSSTSGSPSSIDKASPSSSLTRQVITLTNNRSAMYEKASLPDLALSDCDAVLALDPSHSKARTRRLRILESQKRYKEALVEVCALQLKYMNDNRDKLRLGLPPSGAPPVPQSKIEELVGLIQPEETGRIERELEERRSGSESENRANWALPSTYTIVQLLKSFSGYNKWMGEAAKGGTITKFTAQLEDLLDGVPRKNMEAYVDNAAVRATLLSHRGKRYAFEKNFEQAVSDFDEAYRWVEDVAGRGEEDHEKVTEGIVKAMGKEEYARLLEWEGMCRHLRYDLKGAVECYEKCCELEPENTELLVKRAGVKMDGSHHTEAETLFSQALSLNPTAPDALLHRANLRMLQQRVPDSQTDLETCLRLYPNNLLARLRLATVYMAKEDMENAKKMLDLAEEYEPNSSEVHCYRGELHFAKGELKEARDEFEKAMESDKYNPTPFMNAALAVANTPGESNIPDFPEALRLLEKAIEVDPMFHAAYVQLGQMKLSMATDLSRAREVVELYDRGLEYCRTPEELKDIICMRILTVAQIDAANSLHMETLNMQ